MAGGKLGWLPFYPRDWKSDRQLGRASAGSRGVWIELVSTMFIENADQISGTIEELSRDARCSVADITTFIEDARRQQFCDITECNGVYTLVCRRFVREAKDRQRNREKVSRFRSTHSLQKKGNRDLTGMKPNVPSVSDSVSDSDSQSESDPKRKPKTSWPEDLRLTEEMKTFAEDKQIDAELEFLAWRDDCVAHDRRYCDWQAAWRGRVRNALKFAGTAITVQRSTRGKGDFGNSGMANLAKHLGLNDESRTDGQAADAGQRQLVPPADGRPNDPGLARDPRRSDRRA
jgi:hypothetical protein